MGGIDRRETLVVDFPFLVAKMSSNGESDLPLLKSWTRQRNSADSVHAVAWPMGTPTLIASTAFS